MAGKLKLPRARPVTVMVGIKAGAKYPDGMSVAKVGAILENGDPAHNLLPRPFLYVSLQKIKEWDLQSMFTEGGAELVGKLAAEEIQQTILTWTTPKNADSTIARKGIDAPLRDTMLMTRSVTHWVPGEDDE